MPPSTWPASSFTSAYVANAVRSDATWDVITRSLRAGVPFMETRFAMMATAGKVSSEVISSTISKYLDGLIKILHQFGGDVVKFLGDAVLVSFSPYDEHASSRQEVARRAILCCATIMNELPRVEVDLSAYINIGEIPELNLDCALTEEVQADDEPTSYTSTSKAMSVKRSNSSRMASVTKSNGFSSSGPGSRLSLRLHVAVTCGMVDRCIIGLPDTRMDYVVVGECLNSMSTILDGTGRDQMGVSDAAWYLSGYRVEENPSSADGFVILSSENFCSIASNATLEQSAIMRPPELDLGVGELSRVLKFLPNALAHRIMAAAAEKSEYRLITAAFVKLEWKFSLSLAQRSMAAFVECVNKHYGVFQQFAVDDKGQTMLAFFGQPPFHKGNCARNAADAVLSFLGAWRRQEPDNKMAISLATGEILISVLGNQFRADATGLGKLLSPRWTTHRQKIKGKKQPIGVWSLAAEQTTASPSKSVSDVSDQIGYVDERNLILTAAHEWLEKGSQLLVIVEGPSGVGKTSFMNSTISAMKRQKVFVRFVNCNIII
ncbi:Adenylate cyclase type 10 [Irineochytrium annulatum]|nr:Adenylate cyclase type 10 [Irineochytrium annulatum]